jgi:hypothetical protein
MRYIDLTGKAQAYDIVDQNGNVVGQDTMTLERMLDINCWGQPEWRQDEAWLSAWERLTDGFGAAFKTKAAFVAVDDKDYEKFAPIATFKGKQVAPNLARAVTKLTAPITRASSKEPESAKQLNGAEKASTEVAQS